MLWASKIPKLEVSEVELYMIPINVPLSSPSSPVRAQVKTIVILAYLAVKCKK